MCSETFHFFPWLIPVIVVEFVFHSLGHKVEIEFTLFISDDEPGDESGSDLNICRSEGAVAEFPPRRIVRFPNLILNSSQPQTDPIGKPLQ